jgi:hypothetical protein
VSAPLRFTRRPNPKEYELDLVISTCARQIEVLPLLQGRWHANLSGIAHLNRDHPLDQRD